MKNILQPKPSKKEGSKREVYLAANSDAILSQQKWLSQKEILDDDDESEIEHLQKQVKERDTTLADVLIENLIIQRIYQAELKEVDEGMTTLNRRVSTLEEVRGAVVPPPRRMPPSPPARCAWARASTSRGRRGRRHF